MKKFLLIIIAILSLLFIFFFWGGSLFTQMSIGNTISDFRDSINFSDKKYFFYSETGKYPDFVQNFLKSVISDSAYIPKFVVVEQSGEFKTDFNSEWKTLSAKQYITTESPNYLWDSKMYNADIFWVNAIESYVNGKGNMLIKLNSSITIADSWGIEIDKSGLFRYISDAVLFPTSFIPSTNLMWDVIDSLSAEIKFTNNSNSIVAKLYFYEDYTIKKIETYDKYRALEEGFNKSLYTVYLSEYKTIDKSFTIPTKIEIEWELKSGRFKYGRLKIENIIYE